MTINEYMQVKASELKNRGVTIDLIWVRDAEGNYVTANGNQEFSYVEVENTNNVADITFTL